MKLGTSLYTLFFGKQVGIDSFGNRYYERAGKPGDAPKRWVLYKGSAEPSKVPPEWHGWLHYVDKFPPAALQYSHPWEKPHLPNLTGTAQAYYPPGHILSGGKRDKATGDYEAWQPQTTEKAS